MQLLHERCELLALLARLYELHSSGIAQELTSGDKENAGGGGGSGAEKSTGGGGGGGGSGGASSALFSPDRFAVLLQSLHRAVLHPRQAAQGADAGAAAELERLSESLVSQPWLLMVQLI